MPPRSRAATPLLPGAGRAGRPAAAGRRAARLGRAAAGRGGQPRRRRARYLAHDPGPLPHLFRVLWLFWGLLDTLGEIRAWVEQLLPAADALDPRPAPSCCGLRRSQPSRWATTPRRLRPASAWSRCWTRSATRPARLVPAGPAWTSTIGEDLDGPWGGVSEHGRVPRPGRAHVDVLGRPQRRLGGDDRRPLRRRLGSSDGGARPGGRSDNSWIRRHVTGGPGHSLVRGRAGRPGRCWTRRWA